MRMINHALLTLQYYIARSTAKAHVATVAQDSVQELCLIRHALNASSVKSLVTRAEYTFPILQS